jgi:hypothetical protein
MRTGTKEPKRKAKRAARPKTAPSGAGRGNITVTPPDLRVVSAQSIEQLLDAVDQAVKEGFERYGVAYFDGEQSLPFRQAMIRYADQPARRRNISVRKPGR